MHTSSSVRSSCLQCCTNWATHSSRSIVHCSSSGPFFIAAISAAMSSVTGFPSITSTRQKTFQLKHRTNVRSITGENKLRYGLFRSFFFFLWRVWRLNTMLQLCLPQPIGHVLSHCHDIFERSTLVAVMLRSCGANVWSVLKDTVCPKEHKKPGQLSIVLANASKKTYFGSKADQIMLFIVFGQFRDIIADIMLKRSDGTLTVHNTKTLYRSSYFKSLAHKYFISPWFDLTRVNNTYLSMFACKPP